MNIDIKFQGLDDVIEKLEGYSDIAGMSKAMGKACALVERTAKQNAPKGNGALSNSITSEVKNGASGIEGVIYTPLHYAPYVEYGTGLFAENGGRSDVPWVYCDEKGDFYTTYGQNPHPFLRPAILDNRDKIIRILKEGISND